MGSTEGLRGPKSLGAGQIVFCFMCMCILSEERLLLSLHSQRDTWLKKKSQEKRNSKLLPAPAYILRGFLEELT